MTSTNPRVAALIEKLGYLQKTQYTSIENIAEGGMGSILRVFDERLQRHIALKLVKIGNDEEAEENIARFIQEARITAQLEHPNIMPVHELGMDDYGNIYFAMKEIKGESLEDLLRNIIRFPAIRVPLSHLLDIFLKILDGLSFAHSKGVIHRDLKPGNIMLGAYGEVLVLDWGIAITKELRQNEKNVSVEERNAHVIKMVNERGNIPFQTMAGCVLGTPEYMPPEQAMGLREEIDERSDIYSIGIIMYQMLTTHLPFVAEDPLEVLDMAVNKMPPSPKELLNKKRQEGKSQTRYSRREIPDTLDQIVVKCIQKNREERYQNAKELKKEILTFLDATALQEKEKDSNKKIETSKNKAVSSENKPNSSLSSNTKPPESLLKEPSFLSSNAPTKVMTEQSLPSYIESMVVAPAIATPLPS
ncbi:MAG: serine/threonine-protein kinase, partial [Planctomycetota bacterium]